MSNGPVASLGAKGFRPFFLLAASFAVVIVPLWLLVLGGRVVVRGPLQGVTWHAHEMLFGFTVAVVAGFLTTAVANWTGRETVTGGPLLGLAGLWLAGRVALLAVPGWPAAIVDLAFLPVLALVLARPLIAARSTRNAFLPVLLLAMWAGDLLVHLDVVGLSPIPAAAAHRFALGLIVVLVLVITGRVVPMFTRNATGAAVRNLPALDRAAIGAAAVVAFAQLLSLPVVEAAAAAVAAFATFGRASTWGARSTLREPLLWVLHLAHASLGVGFALTAVRWSWPVLGPSAVHAFTVGGIGLSTLGMMARVSLGHTGRPLRATTPVALGFGLLVLGAVVRVAAPAAPAAVGYFGALWTAAALWSLAFASFTAAYLPILVSPRVDGRPG